MDFVLEIGKFFSSAFPLHFEGHVVKGINLIYFVSYSDSDSDCQGDLRCAQRSSSNGLEDVIGCDFPGSDRYPIWDFCFPVQTVSTGVINYVGECGTENYLCSRCEGDCDVSNCCLPSSIVFYQEKTHFFICFFFIV